MYIVYYDSGTTNTRAYLIKDRRLIGRKQIPVGSRDSARTDGRSYLLQQLHQLYLSLLAEHAVTDEQVTSIYMSGMISSPSGIVEIVHLSTPVSINSLKQQLVTYREELVFHRDLIIIPGIKTIQPGEPITFANIGTVNNMRGEEIELLGIAHAAEEGTPPVSAIVLPGSHTQIAFMEQGAITDILSTITGELFHAITKETLIGSSLETHTDWQLDEDMVRLGYHSLKTYGFNRAVYLVRTMDLFLDSTPSQRVSFMEGVLNGGVMDAIDQKLKTGPEHPGCLGVTGGLLHYRIFDAIAKTYYPHCRIISLNPSDDVPYSVKGLLALIE